VNAGTSDFSSFSTGAAPVLPMLEWGSYDLRTDQRSEADSWLVFRPVLLFW
jgi:hypothetical protein